MTTIEFFKITGLFLLFAGAIITPSYINKRRRFKMTKQELDTADRESDREMSIW